LQIKLNIFVELVDSCLEVIHVSMTKDRTISCFDWFVWHLERHPANSDIFKECLWEV